MTVTIWVRLGGMHGYITKQKYNNDLNKLHRGSLRVLAGLNETRFGRVALEGMQELLRDSCKQVDKITHLHYGKLERDIINISVFQGRDIRIFIRTAERERELTPPKICIKLRGKGIKNENDQPSR